MNTSRNDQDIYSVLSIYPSPVKFYLKLIELETGHEKKKHSFMIQSDLL